METYEKRGYLNSEFRLLHLSGIPKQEFEFHYHDLDKIIIFPKGKMNYPIRGRTYLPMPYNTALVNHNEIHRPDVGQLVPYERIIVCLLPGSITSYKTEEYDPNECFQHTRVAHSNALRVRSLEKNSLFRIIRNLEQACAEEGHANELYRQVLLLEFTIQLNRAYLAHRLDYLKTRHFNQKILAIMDYIGAHLSADLNIDTLSETLYISKYHVTRQFKQETGCITSYYINSRRLLLVRELLPGDAPITQICYDCGFKNYSTFSRAYKSFFGESLKLQRAARTR